MSKPQNSHPYITQNPKICNGNPVIAGTRMRVIDIAIKYDRLGWSPDEIVDEYPHLDLVKIHDALSYYYEHQTELDAEIAARLKKIDEIRSVIGKNHE
ncbi:DUF433 domain-containing protein [Candidatus Poribacteria bacterium]|nr:DUF433 domain-containing protein [Candidatus Poribacteria bacterium]